MSDSVQFLKYQQEELGHIISGKPGIFLVRQPDPVDSACGDQSTFSTPRTGPLDPAISMLSAASLLFSAPPFVPATFSHPHHTASTRDRPTVPLRSSRRTRMKDIHQCPLRSKITDLLALLGLPSSSPPNGQESLIITICSNPIVHSCSIIIFIGFLSSMHFHVSGVLMSGGRAHVIHWLA